MKNLLVLFIFILFFVEARSQTLCNGVTSQTASVTDGTRTITFNFDCITSTYTVTMEGPDDEWMGILFGTTMAEGSPAQLYLNGSSGQNIYSYYINANSSAGVNPISLIGVQSDDTDAGIRTVVSSPIFFDTMNAQEITFSTASTSFAVRVVYHGGGSLNMGYHPVGGFNFLATTLILDSSLPLDVLDFDLNIEDKKVLIDWSVDNVVNVESMIIQRSIDGKIWEDLSKYEVNEKEDFSYIDENPYPANNYYRIKVVDLDGSIDYSYVKSVIMPITNKVEGLITFGPNPFQDQLNFNVSPDLELSDLVQVSLTDATYSTVLKKTIPLRELKNFDFSSLATGKYYMVIAHNDWTQVDRLVKL